MKRFTKVLMALVVGLCLFAVTPVIAEGESTKFDFTKFSIEKLDEVLVGRNQLSVDYEITSDVAFEKNDLNIRLYFVNEKGEFREAGIYSGIDHPFAVFDDYSNVNPEIENLKLLYLDVSMWNSSDGWNKVYSHYSKEELKKYNVELGDRDFVQSNIIEEYSLQYQALRETEIPLDIKSVTISQEKDSLTFDLKFAQNIEEDINEYAFALTFSIESGEASYFSSNQDSTITKVASDEILIKQDVAWQYVDRYDTYKLVSVDMRKAFSSDLETVYPNKSYDANDGIWSSEAMIALLEEYNPNELVKDEDLVIEEVIELQNFGNKLSTECVHIKNIKTGEVIYDFIDKTNPVFQGIPTEEGKTGSVEKIYEYVFTIHGGKTRTIQIPVTVNYYGKSQGTVLMPKDPQQYAVRYDKNIGLGLDLGDNVDYNVRLNDGTIVKDQAIIDQMGGGFQETEDGMVLNEWGVLVRASLKYNLERIDEAFNENNFFSIKRRYYLVDDAGNLVDHKGNIKVPYAQRKDVNYQTLNDDVNVSSLEGSLPQTAVVNAKEKQLENTFGDKAYQAYDITLVANYEEIQPVEEVSVSMELSDELKGKEVEVYYVDDKGNKELVEESVVKDGKVTFKTDHFSTYAVVEKNKSNTGDGDGNESGTPPTPDVDENGNGTPSTPDKENVSTGDNTNVALWVSMMLIGMGVIIVLKKQRHKA